MKTTFCISGYMSVSGRPQAIPIEGVVGGGEGEDVWRSSEVPCSEWRWEDGDQGGRYLQREAAELGGGSYLDVMH